ncbi:RABE1A [Symbiodinium necroappetens]|uniref:RABE1A protein n=1 Tax=Symbiodinium necroappetens TaxID=1628268 RepID=A0A812JV80_9DINO|nr:RABE1A [Symbiodinium necroappetens]
MHLRLAGILPLIAALAASPGTSKSALCATDHAKKSTPAPIRGLLASLRSIGSTVRSDLAFTRRSGGGTAVHASADIYPGEVLFRIPQSALLWRGAHLGIAVVQAGHLTDAERLVLALAAIKKRLQTPPPPIEAYGAFLREEPLPNATILWRTEVLAWLKGTEAAELTEHFLRRIAQIHAAAPLLLEHDDIKAAFAQYYSRHGSLPLGQRGAAEPVMIPGIDFCRRKDGGLKPVLRNGDVELLTTETINAGDEIFVDFGVRDHTDLIVQGAPDDPDAGILLPVPIGTGPANKWKRRLFEHLRWPAEVLLRNGVVQDQRPLRLAAMPREEFTAWSVGALVAGAPLAVSRAFRTETQANAYLVAECSKRGATARSPLSDQNGQNQKASASVARYRDRLVEGYSLCKLRAEEKLRKLHMWAMRQHDWVFRFVHQAVHITDKLPRKIGIQMNALSHPAAASDQNYMASMTVALVNAKVANFVPYFNTLLQVAASPRELAKIRRLSNVMALLQGTSCDEVDLSDFDWINGLQGKDAIGALKYLLPEMESLAQEYKIAADL